MKNLADLIQSKIPMLGGDLYYHFPFEQTNHTITNHTLFADHQVDLANNYDLLNLTCPETIETCFSDYLNAGTDILKTNTYSSTKFSQSDWFIPRQENQQRDTNWFQEVLENEYLTNLCEDINRSAVRTAKKACSKSYTQKYVAGLVGPSTFSLSTTQMEYAKKLPSFQQAVENYQQQIQILIEEEVDLILIGSVFDSQNAIAALTAIQNITPEGFPTIVSAALAYGCELMISAESSLEFYQKIKKFPGLTGFGINCTPPPKHEEVLTEIASTVEIPTVFYPGRDFKQANEFLPMQEHANKIRKLAEKGILNFVGGCTSACPELVAKISNALNTISPRKL